MHPQEIEILLDKMEQLHNQVPIQRFIVPEATAYGYNRSRLQSFNAKGLDHLKEIIQEKGKLNLNKASLIPKPKIPTLDSEIENAGKVAAEIKAAEVALVKASADKASKVKAAKAELRKSEELANLVLFRIVMAARIELYIIGEEKSAAKVDEDKNAYDEKLFAMRELASKLGDLLSVFPFKEIEEHPHIEWKERLIRARDQIAKGNNTSADNSLGSLTKLVLEVLKEQEVERVKVEKKRKSTQGFSVRGGKVRIINDLRGDCVINSQGYINSANDVLHRAMIKHNVSNKKILSMIQHEIDSITNEKQRNSAYILGLEIIKNDPSGMKEKLYELCAVLTRVQDLGKKKALAEIWGAYELSNIKKDQALKLSSSLISMAIDDLRSRNEVLEVQGKSLADLKHQTEKILGELLIKKAREWANYFARGPRLNAERLGIIRKRFGVYLGTLLGPKKEDLREEWMRQARGHVTGALRMASNLYKLISELERLKTQLLDPFSPWNNLNEASSAALKEMADRQYKGIQKRMDEIQKELMKERNQQPTIKMARLMLRIEFDFENRDKNFKKGERKEALRKFYNSKIEDYGPEIARY